VLGSLRPRAGGFPERQAPLSATRRLSVAGALVLTLTLTVSLILAGCKPNKRYDLIEAELRTLERELADTRVALEQARNLNRAYAQQSPQAAVPVAANGGTAAVVVREITLARGTGGVDEDGLPGDDKLMVVVVPRDTDGTPIKVPGLLQIAAWEVSTAGIKTPIGQWTLTPEQLRPTWRNGFISTGFFVTVPWQTYPGTEKVRVAVRLTLPDGQAFEADRDITVKLVQTPRIGLPPVGPPSVGPVPVGPPPVGPPLVGPPPVAPPGRSSAPALGPGRELLVPDPLPPGVEELPPPRPERGARLGPPVRN